MKYIRTKDKIFEKSKLIYGFNNNEEYLIKDIVKEADTIEELCDEIVFRFIGSKNIHITDDLDTVKEFCDNDEPVFGAIWTDKGLIYVAKMNDKGELELL